MESSEEDYLNQTFKRFYPTAWHGKPSVNAQQFQIGKSQCDMEQPFGILKWLLIPAGKEDPMFPGNVFDYKQPF